MFTTIIATVIGPCMYRLFLFRYEIFQRKRKNELLFRLREVKHENRFQCPMRSMPNTCNTNNYTTYWFSFSLHQCRKWI